MFTDTHCHIFDEYYDNIDEIKELMDNNNVYRVINNGTEKKSNQEILKKIQKYEWMYGAIGIHPEEVNNYSEEDLVEIENNINNKKVVAIGEIGLDYHYDKESKDKQIELFEKQLKLAEKYNKPVIIHSREATLDTIECIKKYDVKGVIHCFNGSYETACIYIKLGFLIGINGVITFKNCNLIETLKKIGLDNVVLETDSPYLTPVPYRGHKNNPSHILDIVSFIASKMDISDSEISIITEDNIKRVFDI